MDSSTSVQEILSNTVWLGPIVVLLLGLAKTDKRLIASILIGGLLGLTNPPLKQWFVDNFPSNKAFKRPDTAKNCDIDNSGGNQAGQPGFPSGHMTNAAFYAAILYLFYPNYLSATFGISTVAIMAYARNLCHTPLQRVAGTFLGLVVALIYSFGVNHLF